MKSTRRRDINNRVCGWNFIVVGLENNTKIVASRGRPDMAEHGQTVTVDTCVNLWMLQ